MSNKKVAASATASKNAEKGGGKTQKKVKYVNPFSYTDPLQSKFVNCLMKNGKKTVAQRILKDLFDELNRRGEEDPLKTFEKVIDQVTPTMEVKAKRIGGAVYQIPIEVTEKRRRSLSFRWILTGAKKKKGQPMYKRLATEILDDLAGTGFAIMKKDETHKMAQANKAFAHLARY